MIPNPFFRRLATAAAVVAAAAAMIAPAGALAQSTGTTSSDTTGATAAEIAQRFTKQKSRGLKIAPGTGVAAPAGDGTATAGTATAVASAPLAVTGVTATGVAVAVAAAPVATATASGATGAPVAATDATVLVPVAYAELDADDQVSIRIAFDFDSAVLRDSEKPKLAELCLAMKAVEVEMFQIVGHTDAAGTDAYNDRLSLLRAEEVKRHLVGDCGIPSERLQAVGVGKRFLADPDDPRGETNRRVEFQALS